MKITIEENGKKREYEVEREIVNRLLSQASFAFIRCKVAEGTMFPDKDKKSLHLVHNIMFEWDMY